MSKTKWTKLPAVPGRGNPCLCCSDISPCLGPEMRIAVGFGIAHLERDGEVIWSEPRDSDFDNCMTVAEAEQVAKKAPNHDWRIVLYGPLHGEVYQRQRGKWRLVEKNEGFA